MSCFALHCIVLGIAGMAVLIDINGRGVMSGIIGAENQFGQDFNSPNEDMQGIIVSIYDVCCIYLFNTLLRSHPFQARRRTIVARLTW